MNWMQSYLKGREMRNVVKDMKLKWRIVDGGVPQESVLVPILFLVHMNDMSKKVSSNISLFADNTKLMRHIRNSRR